MNTKPYNILKLLAYYLFTEAEEPLKLREILTRVYVQRAGKPLYYKRNLWKILMLVTKKPLGLNLQFRRNTMTNGNLRKVTNLDMSNWFRTIMHPIDIDVQYLNNFGEAFKSNLSIMNPIVPFLPFLPKIQKHKYRHPHNHIYSRN